jgi:hypothetical protein
MAFSGSHKPTVEIINKGFLDNSALTAIDYSPIITNVSPMFGSPIGNSKITITGKRFN